MVAMLLSILGYIFLIVLSIGFAAFCLFTLYLYHIHRKYAHIPQVPMRSFYFGHKHLLDQAYDEASNISTDEILHDMHRQLGSPPLFLVQVLHMTTVFVLDPKTVKEVMFDKRHPKPMGPLSFYKRCNSMFGQRFAGRGLLTEADYEQWHKRRVILNTAFHRKFLRDSMMEPLNKSADLFIKKLSEKADGKTEIRMLEHFNRCSLDVLAKVAFDLDLDIIENEDSTFNRVMLIILHGLTKAGDILFQMDFRNKASKLKRELCNAGRTLREIGRNCINKRIDEMITGKEVHEDVLTYIIKAGQEVNGDDKEKLEVMIDEFALFFAVGMETTANLMAFTLIAIGRHPEVLHRLMTEIDAVIGDKARVSYEDVNKLEYLMQVLKETLRLWPPVAGMARQPVTDLNVQGYNVPVGAIVHFPMLAMARMEKFFHNAHNFDPDRFQNDEDTMQYTYFPFAIGPKSCIGQQFALIEARVILSRLLKSFRFELVPGQKFTFFREVSLKPREECKVFLTAVK